MRTLRLLIAGLLCLFLSVPVLHANAQDLQKKISLKVEKASLPDVLQQINKKYGIRFSYLNNELAADTIYNFQVQEKPLKEVLDKLLEKKEVGYQQLNGQIIIKKGYPGSKKEQDQKEKAREKKKESASTEAPPAESVKGELLAEKEVSAAKQAKDSIASASPLQQAEESTARPLPAPSPTAVVEPQPVETPEPVKEVEEGPVGLPAEKPAEKDVKAEVKAKKTKPGKEDGPAMVNKNSSAELKEEQPQPIEEKEEHPLPVKLKNSVENMKVKLFEKPERDEAPEKALDPALKPLHFGFVYPISNYGLKSTDYKYRFSLHALVGVSGGLEGLEFTGIGSVIKDSVKGAQFSGIFNLVGDYVEGSQYAGLINTAGGGLKGAQFAGLLNINGEDLRGAQFAGFGNFSSGTGKGFQSAGFINVSKTLRGVQLAGFQNTATEVAGSQFSGFINTAKRIQGFQVAGFINTAGHIKGSQIGFLNFADSMEAGIPIGFLSFIKNGYKALEVYTAEDFQANINFKTGVAHFYNILAIGVETNDSKRWGYGYGIGSEWGGINRFRLNTDLMAYHIIEENYRNFPDGLIEMVDLNNLYKLRLLASLQLGKNLAIFGGPTYNVAVSKYKATPESSPGSALGVSNVFFDRTYNDKTNVKMWIGFNAGIRF